MIETAARCKAAGGYIERYFKNRKELVAQSDGDVEVRFHKGTEADQVVGRGFRGPLIREGGIVAGALVEMFLRNPRLGGGMEKAYEAERG